MSSAGFELAIAASERSQTLVLDRSDFGISKCVIKMTMYCQLYRKITFVLSSSSANT